MPEQSHHDENSAPNQDDHHNVPKPASQERPMTTPAVSERTGDAQYPMGDQIPQASQRDRVAAGYHAIAETFIFAARYAPLRSTRSLLVMNKKGGFDCPSCAWPDPDGKRAPAEFCENGAKAVAWETDSKRANPEFFAKH